MMDRFKISCEWAGKPAEVQFDIKKIPGETGPCYLVSIDGLFRGYIKKGKSGTFNQLMNSNFSDEDMADINEKLRNLTVVSS